MSRSDFDLDFTPDSGSLGWFIWVIELWAVLTILIGGVLLIGYMAVGAPLVVEIVMAIFVFGAAVSAALLISVSRM